MKRVVLLGNGKVAVCDAPDPVPNKDEVLVQIKASAICGSELRRVASPERMEGNSGHEAAGVVLDPNGSARFKQGDRVGISAVYGCGSCKWCREGIYTFCPEHRVHTGMHAELTAAPERALVRLPDDVPFDVGVLLSGDGLGVPYHASRRLLPTPGEMVAIFGCGPVGLGNVLLQSYYGAEVIAVETKPRRLELARALGARHLVDASTRDPREAIAELTCGENVRKCIEATGLRQGFEMAIQSLARMGVLMVVGEVKEATIYPSRDLIRRDCAVMGSWFYHFREFPEMVALYRAGLRVEKLITHRFPLEQAQEAFDLFAAGETGKVILEP